MNKNQLKKVLKENGSEQAAKALDLMSREKTFLNFYDGKVSVMSRFTGEYAECYEVAL